MGVQWRCYKTGKTISRILKKKGDYSENIVPINFKTASTAKLTALALKEDKKTILIGKNLRGMVEYSYHAFSTKTDCSEFKVILSTKPLVSD